MFTLSTLFHAFAFSYFYSLCAFEFKWDFHIRKELKQNSFLFTAPLSTAEVTTNSTKAGEVFRSGRWRGWFFFMALVCFRIKQHSLAQIWNTSWSTDSSLVNGPHGLGILLPVAQNRKSFLVAVTLVLHVDTWEQEGGGPFWNPSW